MKIFFMISILFSIFLAGCSSTIINDDSTVSTTSKVNTLTSDKKTTTSTLPPDYIPEDLQVCSLDSDCILVDEYPITMGYCGTSAINKKYKDWYDDIMEKRKPYDNVVCEPLPKQEVICIDNKCTIRNL